MKVTTVTTSRIELSVEEKNILNDMINFINGIDKEVWDSLSSAWRDRLTYVCNTCYALAHHSDVAERELDKNVARLTI